jgi:hypothetical protein
VTARAAVASRVGHDPQPEVRRQGEDGPHQGLVLRPHAEAGHEPAVDLQLVDGQDVEVAGYRRASPYPQTAPVEADPTSLTYLASTPRV